MDLDIEEWERLSKQDDFGYAVYDASNKLVGWSNRYAEWFSLLEQSEGYSPISILEHQVECDLDSEYLPDDKDTIDYFYSIDAGRGAPTHFMHWNRGSKSKRTSQPQRHFEVTTINRNGGGSIMRLKLISDYIRPREGARDMINFILNRSREQKPPVARYIRTKHPHVGGDFYFIRHAPKLKKNESFLILFFGDFIETDIEGALLSISVGSVLESYWGVEFSTTTKRAVRRNPTEEASDEDIIASNPAAQVLKFVDGRICTFAEPLAGDRNSNWILGAECSAIVLDLFNSGNNRDGWFAGALPLWQVKLNGSVNKIASRTEAKLGMYEYDASDFRENHQVKSFKFDNYDIFIVASDGVFEAENANGYTLDCRGFENMIKRAVKECYEDLHDREDRRDILRDKLVDRFVETYPGEPQDDQMILVLDPSSIEFD